MIKSFLCIIGGTEASLDRCNAQLFYCEILHTLYIVKYWIHYI